MRAWILALVTLIAAAGCGDDHQHAGSGSALESRTFVAQEVHGHQVLAGTEIRLAFDGGGISAYAGCNHLFAEVTVSDDVLTVSGLGSTDMGCDPAHHDQDSWLADLLTSGPRWDLDGNRLTLSSATAEIVLLDRVEADPDRALEGTRWVVDSTTTGSGPDDSVSSTPLDVEAYVVLSDGSFEGSTGCNSISGRYRAEDGSLVITSIARTVVGCLDPAHTDLEEAVMSALNGRVSYEIMADRLTLRASSGEGLILHADE